MNTDKHEVGKKILLVLLPFWTPLIPPQGISRLKGFLQEHGCIVETRDANLEHPFKKLYDKYFNTLKAYVPLNQRGNFYNIGNDVWREHMMAHINYDDEKKYIELVKILVYKIFYCRIDTQQVTRLNDILSEFYLELERYVLVLLEEKRPDVLGISVYRDTLPASLFAFRTAKSKYPHLMTVMGGGIFSIQLPAGSPNWDYFMKETEPYIDKIIVGEGEKILLNILKENFPEQQRLFTKEDMPAEVQEFPSLDIYDFSDFDNHHYHYLAAQASTGCPNQCSFCNVNSFYGAYRKKNPAKVVEEMIELHKRYGGRLFFMLDSLLNQMLTDITHEFLKAGISLFWDAYLRVDESCTRENARLWRQGGFYRARIGIESGSQRVLDLMNKNITVEQIRTAVSNLAAAGIKTTLYVVIGHPGETEQDFQLTLDLVSQLKDDIWEAECNPFTYFYSGQSGAGGWAKKSKLLYPAWAKEMLITQTWILNGEPSRKKMYHRIYRFVDRCRRLGISTPWSLHDVNKSDERWKRLHKDAVPTVLELIKQRNDINREDVGVKHLTAAIDTHPDDEEFDF